ncbi:MAG TPA: GNAT family protein [Bdellovibrionota bacterium]|jgi:RimJ/RimL family protein N-acetyltransferase
MARAIPKLEFQTKRFVIRIYRASDYTRWRSAYESMFPKQSEFDQDRKSHAELSRKEFLKLIAQQEKYRQQGLIYHFGIFEKRTGRMMGFILLALVMRFNVQSARISYAIFNNYWKHGYGKEAVQAAIEFSFRKMKLHRLEAEILPHNHASVALVRGLGFQFEGVRRGAVYFNRKWHDHAVYALLAEDRGVRNMRPSVFV